MKKLFLIGTLFLVLAGPVLGDEGKDAVQNGDQAFKTRDYTAAFQLYQQAAREGNASAKNNLGYLYEHGLGAKQDYAQAVSYYRSAAESGNAAAQNNLGRLYAKGLGVAKDMRESFRRHSQAALRGDPEGEYWVGYDYALGRGVKRDLTKAAGWMKQSAQAGYAPAQAGLASLYQEGLGVKKDESQSKEWAHKAKASQASEVEAAKEPTDSYSYTVTAGDCLWKIARRLLAKGRLWSVIYEANKDRVHDPKLIHPGEILTIQKSNS